MKKSDKDKLIYQLSMPVFHSIRGVVATSKTLNYQQKISNYTLASSVVTEKSNPKYYCKWVTPSLTQCSYREK